MKENVERKLFISLKITSLNINEINEILVSLYTYGVDGVFFIVSSSLLKKILSKNIFKGLRVRKTNDFEIGFVPNQNIKEKGINTLKNDFEVLSSFPSQVSDPPLDQEFINEKTVIGNYDIEKINEFKKSGIKNFVLPYKSFVLDGKLNFKKITRLLGEIKKKV